MIEETLVHSVYTREEKTGSDQRYSWAHVGNILPRPFSNRAYILYVTSPTLTHPTWNTLHRQPWPTRNTCRHTWWMNGHTTRHSQCKSLQKAENGTIYKNKKIKWVGGFSDGTSAALVNLKNTDCQIPPIYPTTKRKGAKRNQSQTPISRKPQKKNTL